MAYAAESSPIRPAKRLSLFHSPWRFRRETIIGFSAFVAWLPLLFLLPTDLPFNNDQNAHVGGVASLRAGHGYRFEQYVNLPRIGIYPPGYSLWLAFFWKGGQTIAANSTRMEFANIIAAGCALFALAACFALSELPAWWSSVTLLLLGTSVVFTQSTFWLKADILFTAGSCILALLVGLYKPARKLSVWWFAAGIISGLLYLIKTSALAYIIGLAAFGILKRDFRRFTCLVYFSAPVCSAITMWFLLAKDAPTYGTYFISQISEIGGASGYLVRTIKQAVLYSSGRWLVEALLNIPDRLHGAHAFVRMGTMAELLAFVCGLAFVLPIFGGLRKGPKNAKEQIICLLLGATALEFVLWPYYLGARSAIAIIPFLSDYLWKGVSSRAARGIILSILFLNVPANSWLSYKTIRSQENESVQSLASLKDAASWINKTGGLNASVAAGRDIPLFHFYEYLGRRVLANARPITHGKYTDVNPSTQDNRWADYLIVDRSFYLVANDLAGWDENGFIIQQVFGPWTIATPRR